MNKKWASVWFFIIVIGLAFLGTTHFGVAQTGTNVSGTIASDTTWTKTNSPYDLNGNVFVSQSATLTMEAGVTVNFYQNKLQVNGTLKVLGSNDANVIFSSSNRNITDARSPIADVVFGDESFGNIIENTIFETMGFTFYNCTKSIVINNNTFADGAVPTYSGGFISILPTIRGSGSATITNNKFTGGLQDFCSSTIANNTFIRNGVEIGGGSFLVLNNTFIGNSTSHPFGNYDSFGVSIDTGARAVVSDNYFSDFREECINVQSLSFAWIQRNSIQNKLTTAGYPFFGIEISGSSPVVENNTITNCNVGIDVFSYGPDYSAVEAKPTIINNNIFGNTLYNVYLGYPDRGGYHTIDFVAGNVDASENWWGTTDAQAINQTMRDNKVQSNLGVVNFLPLLTAPNPQATPNPAASTPPIFQVPMVTFLNATGSGGGAVELLVNGNLTVGLGTLANVTANELLGTTNVTFTILGNQGTSGFTNVTIPIRSVPYGSYPAMYFDNESAQNQGYTEDQNNYYVWGTLQFNSYLYGDLSVLFASSPVTTVSPSPSIPEFSMWVILLPLIISMLVTSVYLRRKLKTQ